MGVKWTKFNCHNNTKELIMNDCKESFLKHHPEMKGIHLSENFILYKLAMFYLGND